MIIENDLLKLELDDFGRVLELRDCNTGFDVPINSDALSDAFEIQLRDKSGETTRITPSAKAETREHERTVTCTWEESGPWGKLRVCGSINLPEGSSVSYWEMAIENNTDMAIFQVAWPRISGLQDYESDSYMAHPLCMGEKTPNPVSFVNQPAPDVNTWGRQQYGYFDAEGAPADIAFAYPGMFTMQFLALGQEDKGGLYFAAYDSQALYKCFGLYKDAEGHAALVMKQYPEDRTAAGADFSSFYSTVIGMYSGQWWDASKIYREWGTRQFWCAKGKSKDREEIPAWVKNNDLWYWNWQFPSRGHPRQVVPIVVHLKQRFECGTAVHWYGSNGEVFNAWRCPEIYPENEDVRNTIKKGMHELHEADIHAIPYLEARLVNENNQWFKEHGKGWICIDERGESADYWGIMDCHSMCPTAPPFHDLIRDQLLKMMDGCDMDGAYLDQITGCYPAVCFNPAHDHPAGGHDHWVRGYRSMLEKIRKAMRDRKSDSVISSEGVCECFLDMFDIDLERGISNTDCRTGCAGAVSIPLFHSVYHDYHITYGTVSTMVPRTRGDSSTMEGYYYREALCLTGGGQLMASGIFAGDEKKDHFQPFLDYLGELTKAHVAGREYFNHGRWMPPLALGCDSIAVTYHANRPPIRDVPAILSGCFEYEGSLVIVLVNHTDRKRDLNAVQDLADYGLPGTVRATRLYPDNKDMGHFRAEFSMRGEIAPLSVQLFLIAGEKTERKQCPQSLKAKEEGGL